MSTTTPGPDLGLAITIDGEEDGRLEGWPEGHPLHVEAISTEPENRTDVTAMKDEVALAALPGYPVEARASDPATSHEAAKAATRSLRRRMIDVLAEFQDHAVPFVKMGEEDPGYTDEELVRRLEAKDAPGSPSGWRTARKDLVRAGLLGPKMLGTIEDTRRTRRGNPAIIYVLTEAGGDLDLAGIR